MATVERLRQFLQDQCHQFNWVDVIAVGELTLELPRDQLIPFCQWLRDQPDLAFDGLMDLCGVDYLTYGVSEWETHRATGTGFERAVDRSGEKSVLTWDKPRFAVVYHLLSTFHGHRLRLRVFLDEAALCVDSVTDIWSAANWFERETFDLYGILFQGHKDLRRILTDYGFVGYPLRKDFPLIGEVEARYDATLSRVIYEPVSIEPRVLVPKVIRDDNRYGEVK